MPSISQHMQSFQCHVVHIHRSKFPCIIVMHNLAATESVPDPSDAFYAYYSMLYPPLHEENMYHLYCCFGPLAMMSSSTQLPHSCFGRVLLLVPLLFSLHSSCAESYQLCYFHLNTAQHVDVHLHGQSLPATAKPLCRRTTRSPTQNRR